MTGKRLHRATLVLALVLLALVVPSALPGTANEIVFVRGLFRIWVTAPDGTHQRQLTRKISNFPVWSPDRRWIAYTAESPTCAAASQEIWLMRPDGRGNHRLTNLCPAQAIGLSWSPDGTQIAFGRSASRPGGIWAVNVNASGATAITHDQADGNPAWSPDGKHLLFTKQCCSVSGPQWNQPSTLFIVNADGSEGHRLLALPRSSCGDEVGSWSPDSRWIAFDRCIYTGPLVGEGERPDRHDIWLAKPDGTGLRRLLKNAADPSWSPDGHWLVFSRTVGEGASAFTSLFKIDARTHALTRLTRDPRGDTAPNW